MAERGDDIEAGILQLHALEHGPNFLEGLLRILRLAVPAPYALCGVSDLQNVTFSQGRRYPIDIDRGRYLPVFAAHFWEHPLNQRSRHVPIGAVVTIQEIAGARPWHMTGQYNEFCRPNGIENQLMMRLPAPEGLVDAVGIARPGRAFSEAEQQRFLRLKPHILVAHQRARALADRAVAPTEALAEWQTGHLVIDDEANVRFAGAGTGELLARFFPVDSRRRADELPRELREWAPAQLGRLPAHPPVEFQWHRPMRSGLRRLRAWVVPGFTTGTHDVYLRICPRDEPAARPASTAEAPPPERFDNLPAQIERVKVNWGLSPRQAAVLALVADGRGNKETAAALGCAEVTVEYHLTGVFRRAAVANRAALIARFWNER